MGKPGRPAPRLDDYLYWQERLANRLASGLSVDDFCIAEAVSRSRSIVRHSDFARACPTRCEKRDGGRLWPNWQSRSSCRSR